MHLKHKKYKCKLLGFIESLKIQSEKRNPLINYYEIFFPFLVLDLKFS